ncbi:MAG: ChbG/HpnK family deacetylase [Acidimicrobiia bacterium]|nr:ChbG/HpnK family deacetylase [Acidimicrobiia bacterium]
MTPAMITHIDDLGCSLGSVVSMEAAFSRGSVTSGSAIVPAGWFPEVVRLAGRIPAIDLGVHLALTSESAAFRWAPLSTRSRASGLMDDAGYLWSDVPSVRRHAHPAAVEEELHAQVEAALLAGIDVTHLDHHMGAALAPEFAEATARVAEHHRIPMLFPVDLAGYVSVLNMGPLDLEPLEPVRARLVESGLVFGDRFVMGLTYRDGDADTEFRRLLESPGHGLTFVSLHCAAPGDIERVHPADAHWRIAEHRLFNDDDFAGWLASRPANLVGCRQMRDAARSR